MNFFLSYSKILSNQWGLSRCYAILVTKNWSSSDPDPKLIITDPNSANNFGSERFRIHNTDKIDTYRGTYKKDKLNTGTSLGQLLKAKSRHTKSGPEEGGRTENQPETPNILSSFLSYSWTNIRLID